MDKKQIGVLALDYGLNSKDRNEVLEYQGKGQEYSQQRIDSLINSVLGTYYEAVFSGDKDMAEMVIKVLKKV